MRTAPTDPTTDRKFFLDVPSDVDTTDDELVFVLNLHGGGSSGPWQRAYFPACDLVDSHRLVVATPTSALREPIAMWTEDDDPHLQAIVTHVLDRFATRIRSFWLAGHSQGGMTSRRLLGTDWFADRVDGWLSLSGGRIGRATFVPDFGPPRPKGQERPRLRRPSMGKLETDISHIFVVGEHEIVELPDTSPLAERYGAGARVQLPDVVDTEKGQVDDPRFHANPTLSWGRPAAPGTAQVFEYPGAADGRVIVDVVRIDKGHTEGLEPEITRTIVELMQREPGRKVRALAGTA